LRAPRGGHEPASELPGDTAEAMFLALGKTNHARFILRLLQAEMQGITSASSVGKVGLKNRRQPARGS
jgi:hypothetical protein